VILVNAVPIARVHDRLDPGRRVRGLAWRSSYGIHVAAWHRRSGRTS